MKYIIAGMYITLIYLANMTAGVIIATSLGISLALGTLFFGFIFTLRDYIHSVYGKLYAIGVIITAAVVNLVLSLLGAFDIRILIASVIAFLTSELTDTEIYHRASKDKWYLRVLKSNIVSIPIDTVLFTTIAFAGIWDINTMISVIIGDIIVKFLTSASIIWLRKERKK